MAIGMKPSLSLRMSQQLTLTPQLQQSIRLLQLSTLEMEQEIEQALEENPFLEREDDHLIAEDFGLAESDQPISEGDYISEAQPDWTLPSSTTTSEVAQTPQQSVLTILPKGPQKRSQHGMVMELSKSPPMTLNGEMTLRPAATPQRMAPLRQISPVVT